MTFGAFKFSSNGERLTKGDYVYLPVNENEADDDAPARYTARKAMIHHAGYSCFRRRHFADVILLDYPDEKPENTKENAIMKGQHDVFSLNETLEILMTNPGASGLMPETAMDTELMIDMIIANELASDELALVLATASLARVLPAAREPQRPISS